MNHIAPQIEDPEAIPAATPEPTPVPSWFTQPVADNAEPSPTAQRLRERIAQDEIRRRAERENLARYTQRLEEKLAASRQMIEPTLDAAPQPRPRAMRPTVPPDHLMGQAQRYEREHDAHVAVEPRPGISRNFKVALVMGCCAMFLGTSLGFAFAKRDSLIALLASGRAQAKSVLASLSQPLPDAGSASSGSGETSIARKPIAMAALTVSDARGILGGQIPLTLDARPMSDGGAVDVLISGLPPAAYLSAGHATDNGKWLVNSSDIAGLKLVIPASDKSRLDLEVAALAQGTQELAAPAQKLHVDLAGVTIAPASAPPDEAGGNVVVQPAATAATPSAATAQPIPAPLPAKGADLVAKADGLLRQGDILSARQVYLQAAGMGNGQAMAGVGRTYDPKVFADLKISGLQPDQAKADDWYKKARAAGVALN